MRVSNFSRVTTVANAGLYAITILAVALVAEPVDFAAYGQSPSFEQPPIDYLNGPTEDAVARLAERLGNGSFHLEFDDRHGYLPAVLDALDVPVSSQTLVFSKTSLQLHRISPRQPRALYFSDDVYVGWCQRGDVLELAATDAKQGAIFYTLEQVQSEAPTILRDRGQCLTCHASSRTQNVPGYLVRSVQASAAGHPILGSGTYTSDHTSPFKQRWGGWYVTGTHGEMRHMGNVLSGKRSEKRSESPDFETGANRQTLEPLFDTSKYLTGHSDLVALMVLEHQTQTHNSLALASYETRQAMHQSFEMNRILEREPGFLSESAERRINTVAENAVRHLLMCDEFQLTSPVRGTSEFADDFAKRGPHDSSGRTLRELDLETRLFKYPCSYLIYSAAFKSLPDEVRIRIVTQVKRVLDGKLAADQFSHLSTTMRQDILAILRETHEDFDE